MRSSKGLQSFGLEGVFKGRNRSIFQTVDIRKQWPLIVGDYLDQKTFVKKIEGTVLWVCVEHGGWAHQLNMMKSELIKKINAKTKMNIFDIKWVYEGIEQKKAISPKIEPQKRFHKRAVANQNQSLDEILKRVRSLHQEIHPKS